MSRVFVSSLLQSQRVNAPRIRRRFQCRDFSSRLIAQPRESRAVSLSSAEDTEREREREGEREGGRASDAPT